ncbi:MAG: addiction module protein [Polyangiaceae bacterium]
MTAIALDLFSAALALPDADRIELASRLLASVEGNTVDSDWDDAWLAELDQREQRAAADGDAGSSWADVKARVLSRLAAR